MAMLIHFFKCCRLDGSTKIVLIFFKGMIVLFS